MGSAIGSSPVCMQPVALAELARCFFRAQARSPGNLPSKSTVPRPRPPPLAPQTVSNTTQLRCRGQGAPLHTASVASGAAPRMDSWEPSGAKGGGWLAPAQQPASPRRGAAEVLLSSSALGAALDVLGPRGPAQGGALGGALGGRSWPRQPG